MDNVFYLKLTNGEDIVCQIVSQDNDQSQYLISDPLKVNYQYVPTSGRMMVGFSRWIPLQRSPVISIYFDHVLALSEVSEELIEFYQSAIGSEELEDAIGDFESSGLDEDQMKMALYLANTSTTLN